MFKQITSKCKKLNVTDAANEMSVHANKILNRLHRLKHIENGRNSG